MRAWIWRQSLMAAEPCNSTESTEPASVANCLEASLAPGFRFTGHVANLLERYQISVDCFSQITADYSQSLGHFVKVPLRRFFALVSSVSLLSATAWGVP